MACQPPRIEFTVYECNRIEWNHITIHTACALQWIGIIYPNLSLAYHNIFIRVLGPESIYISNPSIQSIPGRFQSTWWPTTPSSQPCPRRGKGLRALALLALAASATAPALRPNAVTYNAAVAAMEPWRWSRGGWDWANLGQILAKNGVLTTNHGDDLAHKERQIMGGQT